MTASELIREMIDCIQSAQQKADDADNVDITESESVQLDVILYDIEQVESDLNELWEIIVTREEDS